MARIRQQSASDHTRIARIRRDDAFGRLAAINKSIGIGTLVVTAVLGLYLSKALPGHHTAVQSPSTSSSASNTALAGPSTSGSSSGSGQLAPPSTRPVPAQQPAPVVSGAT